MLRELTFCVQGVDFFVLRELTFLCSGSWLFCAQGVEYFVFRELNFLCSWSWLLCAQGVDLAELHTAAAPPPCPDRLLWLQAHRDLVRSFQSLISYHHYHHINSNFAQTIDYWLCLLPDLLPDQCQDSFYQIVFLAFKYYSQVQQVWKSGQPVWKGTRTPRWNPSNKQSRAMPRITDIPTVFF